MKRTPHHALAEPKFRVKIVEQATGDPITDLDFESTGLIISTIADNEASGTAYTTTDLEDITTIGTYAAPTSGKCRFAVVDATNHPGLYEVQFAAARFAVSGAMGCIVSIHGYSGMLQVDFEVFFAEDSLDADLSKGADVSGRTVRNSYRVLRNKHSESGGTLTVCKENDSTEAWAATVTRNAAAEPITGIDPA